jgi:dynein heavy chain
MEKMKADWKVIHFTFTPYKDKGISILAAIDDIQVLLDDHIVKTTTMKNSPFIKPFESDVNQWDAKLVRHLFIMYTALLSYECWFDSGG